MLKKSLLYILLFISATAHALPRDEGELLSFKTRGNDSSPKSNDALIAESEFPRRNDTAESVIMPDIPLQHGLFARTHHQPSKKTAAHGSSRAKSFSDDRLSSKTYRVRKGDTLYSIARKFHVSPDAICARNNISPSSRLRVGEKLKIPQAKHYEQQQSSNTADDGILHVHSSVRFSWPVRSVLSVRRDEASGVRPLGIIIESSLASPVISSAKGTVEKIGTMRGYGQYVIVKHASHYLTVYSGLKNVHVQEGEEIRRGKPIGTHEGNIHFQIHRAGRPINPLQLLPDRG